MVPTNEAWRTWWYSTVVAASAAEESAARPAKEVMSCILFRWIVFWGRLGRFCGGDKDGVDGLDGCEPVL